MKTQRQLALELRSMVSLVIGKEYFKLCDAMGSEKYIDMMNDICGQVWPEHIQRFHNPDLLMSGIWGPTKEAIKQEFDRSFREKAEEVR